MNFNQSFARYLTIASNSYSISQIAKMHSDIESIYSLLKKHYELDVDVDFDTETENGHTSFFEVKSSLREKIALQIGINMLSKYSEKLKTETEKLIDFGKNLNDLSVFIKAFKYIHKC